MGYTPPVRELTSTLATLTSTVEGAETSTGAEEEKKKFVFLQPGVRPPLGGTPGRGVIRYSSSLYIDAGRPPLRYLPFRGEPTCQITKASELKSQTRCPPPQTPGGRVDIFHVAAAAGIGQYDTCLDFPIFLFITHSTPALIRAPILRLFYSRPHLAFALGCRDMIQSKGSAAVSVCVTFSSLSWNSCHFQISLCFDVHVFHWLNACSIFGRSERISL